MISLCMSLVLIYISIKSLMQESLLLQQSLMSLSSKELYVMVSHGTQTSLGASRLIPSSSKEMEKIASCNTGIPSHLSSQVAAINSTHPFRIYQDCLYLASLEEMSAILAHLRMSLINCTDKDHNQ